MVGFLFSAAKSAETELFPWQPPLRKVRAHLAVSLTSVCTRVSRTGRARPLNFEARDKGFEIRPV